MNCFFDAERREERLSQFSDWDRLKVEIDTQIQFQNTKIISSINEKKELSHRTSFDHHWFQIKNCQPLDSKLHFLKAGIRTFPRDRLDRSFLERPKIIFQIDLNCSGLLFSVAKGHFPECQGSPLTQLRIEFYLSVRNMNSDSTAV
ncbi:hypothetical protein TNCV_3370551 [Trichonephila clavipes]|nr:hypothetical protein TNCV_3370551 [Trichonephila clavipes]